MGVLDHLGVLQHFLHVVLVDVAHTSCSLVAVAPSNGEIAFGKVGSSSNLVGSAAILLLCRQHVVSKLEVVDDFLHQFVMSELVVRRLLLGMIFINILIHPRHLIPHLHEFEIEVGTKEAHLSLTNLCQVFAQLVFAILGEGDKCTVAARDAAVEVIPLFVHVVGGGCGERRPHLYGVVVGVGSTRAALHSIVRRYVSVRPEVEGIGVPVVAELCIGRGDHLFGLAHGEVFADDALRLDVNEIVTAGKGECHDASYETSAEYFICRFHNFYDLNSLYDFVFRKKSGYRTRSWCC